MGAIAVGIAILSVVIYKAETAGMMPPPAPPNYYSADDGQTYFISHEFKHAPFFENEKEVDSVSLFAGSDGKPFVGFLFKYTSQGQAMLSGFKTDSVGARQAAAQYALVKRPGDKNWVSAESARGREIIGNVVDPKMHQPATAYVPS